MPASDFSCGRKANRPQSDPLAARRTRSHLLQYMNDGALRVYLNDHLAGSVLGAQTARHLLAHRSEGALAEFLRAFLGELTEERAILSEVMVLLAAPLNPFKLLGAWALEKAQELKLQ